ncbi:MAG: hypothetical protein HN739_00705 [Gammaproteobacteria bacterium]|nr:hypothetical protein [Gammaproteobacteria bacterium]
MSYASDDDDDAFSATLVEQEVIYACVKYDEKEGSLKKDSPLRYTEPFEDCKKNEVRVSWNTIGPEGPEGPEGFDPKLMATLQKILDPNRFYPDLKNDPDLFIALPEMAGFWAGEIKDGDRSDTTGMNINLISKYKPGYNQHTWFGFAVKPSADGSAWSESNAILDPSAHVWKHYGIDIRSHLRFEKGMWVSYEATPEFRAQHPTWDWRGYLISPLVTLLMNSLYDFMEFDSGKTKFCERLVVTIDSNYEFSFAGSICEYVE